mgnify:CR=1 FL=1
MSRAAVTLTVPPDETYARLVGIFVRDAAERAQGRRLLDRVLAASPADPARRKVIGVFANATGPKFLGPDWWKWLIAVYLWHLVYAINLGALYQPNETPAVVTAEASS